MSKKYTILAFDDHANGQAYLNAYKFASQKGRAVTLALDLLKSHDHICVARTKDLPEMDFITFRQALRYSIILEAGINAEL